MGDCQLHDGQCQTRHMYLVMLAYSVLTDRLVQNRAKVRASRKLATIGEACRAVLRETLPSTIAWAIEQATKYFHELEHITTRPSSTRVCKSRVRIFGKNLEEAVDWEKSAR